jgi:hypothetical protein
MSLQTFACPACGSRKTLADAQPGEKLHCTCGMSYPASPVFAVADAGDKKAGGPSIRVLVLVALLVGCGGVAAWLMTRPPGPSHDQGGGQVVVAPNPVDLSPNIPDERPTPVPTPNPANVRPIPPAKAGPDKPPIPAPIDKPPPPPLSAPVASIAADTLWDAFDLGATFAARYTGKVVEVKARGRVARDSIDRPYFGAVVVKPRGRTTPRMTPEEKQWEKDGYPPSVRCYLSPEQAATLEKREDQDVVLRGICIGRKDRDDVYRGYIVELDNCVVVAPK